MCHACLAGKKGLQGTTGKLSTGDFMKPIFRCLSGMEMMTGISLEDLSFSVTSRSALVLY